MKKIIVAGAAGRMGKTVIECARTVQGVQVIAGLDRPNCAGNICGVKIGADTAVIKKADVLIDFSEPHASLHYLDACVSYGKPMVIGTTGFSRKDHKKIRTAAIRIPVVLSPNMSSGINLLFKLCAMAGRALKDYDMEIVEVHHNKKKDAPSGTAVKLASILSGVSGITRICYGRSGAVGERPRREIGVHAVRAGDIVGEHTVIFAGPGERLELVHRAHSRDTFASGALRSARWVIGKKAKLYSMEDVLSEH